MNLQIQCPNCTKRFTVHEDLTGKTVECGACDHRFPVKSESIIVERAKFYPGEHRDEFLNRLGKNSPLAGDGPGAAPAPMNQGKTPQVDSIMPASPGQAMAAGVGFTMLLLYSLLFFFGTSPGNLFQDVDLPRRFLLGGFVSILGGGLIIFGAKNWRAKGLMSAVVLIAALMAMIVLRPVHVTPETEIEVASVDEVEEEKEDDGVRDLDDFISSIDEKAMKRELARQEAKLDGEPADNFVTGIYIADLRETQYQAIERYFRKKLSLPKSEALSVYKREGDKDRFIVISGVPMDFDLMVSLCEFLGRTTSYPKKRILDVELSARHFQAPTEDLLDKLNNPENPAFFTQNLNELRNIDFERVSEAVRRLGRVPEEMELKNRDQIIEELLLLASEETGSVILSDIGQALKLFGQNSLVAVTKINQLIPHWLESEIPVEKSMVEFLVENGDPEVIALIDRLWVSNPTKWDELYLSLGNQIEDRMLTYLADAPQELKRSAISLLGQIGTQKSIPALEAEHKGDDQEARILADRALEAIKSRQ